MSPMYSVLQETLSTLPYSSRTTTKLAVTVPILQLSKLRIKEMMVASQTLMCTCITWRSCSVHILAFWPEGDPGILPFSNLRGGQPTAGWLPVSSALRSEPGLTGLVWLQGLGLATCQAVV